MFKVPVVRELFLAMGYVDARRSVAAKVLETGRSLFVVTGGEEEVLRCVRLRIASIEATNNIEYYHYLYCH